MLERFLIGILISACEEIPHEKYSNYRKWHVDLLWYLHGLTYKHRRLFRFED